MGILQIFTLLGALGMFLYGMNLMKPSAVSSRAEISIRRNSTRLPYARSMV